MPQQTRRFDVVTIHFRRNRATGRRHITSFNVMGRAFPCRHLLRVGNRVSPVRRCLLLNGFVLTASTATTLVFRRRR